MSMFCEKCGSILVPDDDGNFVCPRCGWKGEEVTLSEESKGGKEVHMVRETDENALPKTKVKCPKCGNDEAYYFVYQTRAADEAPTIFYKCTKCGYRWRSYD